MASESGGLKANSNCDSTVETPYGNGCRAVCLSACLRLSEHVCLFVCLSACLRLSVSLSVCQLVFVCLSVCLSLSFCLSLPLPHLHCIVCTVVGCVLVLGI